VSDQSYLELPDFAASVGLRIDVEHSVIRLLLTFFILFLPRVTLLGAGAWSARRQVPFEIQRTLVLGLLNAVVGVTLFHFLDKLREPA
jgi:hypothetical protein